MADDDTIHAEQAEPGPAATASPGEVAHHDELIPVWLAVLVLVLLLAVVGVAGFAIRARLTAPRPSSVQDLALQRAEQAVAASPDDLQAHLDLGFANQQRGSFDAALAEYALVLAQDRKNTAALYNSGVIYLKLGDTKRGEAALRGVLAVSKTHVLAAKALGDYYAGRKQYEKLVAVVKPVVDVRPDMADLQYLLGVAYENLGNKTAAIARYRLALQYVPDMPEPRDGLSRLGAKR